MSREFSSNPRPFHQTLSFEDSVTSQDYHCRDQAWHTRTFRHILDHIILNDIRAPFHLSIDYTLKLNSVLSELVGDAVALYWGPGKCRGLPLLKVISPQFLLQSSKTPRRSKPQFIRKDSFCSLANQNRQALSRMRKGLPKVTVPM